MTKKGCDPDVLAMTLHISGIVDNVGFEEFAFHYARRLNLVGRYESLGGGVLRITLFGRSELIEMFKIACSLGPRIRQILPTHTPAEKAGMTDGASRKYECRVSAPKLPAPKTANCNDRMVAGN